MPYAPQGVQGLDDDVAPLNTYVPSCVNKYYVAINLKPSGMSNLEFGNILWAVSVSFPLQDKSILRLDNPVVLSNE
jgi:hypothetical protein